MLRIKNALDAHPLTNWQYAPAKIRKGATLPALDAEIDAGAATRKELRSNRVSSADVADRAEALISKLAQRGQPQVNVGGVAMPSISVRNGSSNEFARIGDGVALVAWLFEDELKAKVRALIELEAPADDALQRDDCEARQRGKRGDGRAPPLER